MSFNVFASADVFAAGDTNLDNFACLNPREPCQTSFTNSIMQRLNIVQGGQGHKTLKGPEETEMGTESCRLKVFWVVRQMVTTETQMTIQRLTSRHSH